MWSGTYGQQLHRQGLLCTTPSAAPGVRLPHYGYGAVQVCSTAAWHHHAAISGHPLPRRLAGHLLRSPGCPFVRGRPPANAVAHPSSGSTWSTLRRVLHLLWPRPGLPSRRHRVSSSFSSRIRPALLRALPLPGPRGGFQAATTGYEEVSCDEEFCFLNFGVRLDEEFHRVALWRFWFSFFHVPVRSG